MKRKHNLHSDKAPQAPIEKIRYANWLAEQIIERYNSYQIMLDRIKRIADKPRERSLFEASNLTVLWSYFLLVLFIITLIVDWDFNRQAFQSQNLLGFLVFAFLVLMGLLSSACFSPLFYDFNSHISALPDTNQYYIISYESKTESAPKWQLRHWLTGLFFFVITMLSVYKLSEQRVFWQQTIDPNYPDDSVVPLIIFFFTIVTGMGAHFIIERTWVLIKHKQYENKLNVMENEIQELTHKCLKAYDEYVEEMEELEKEAMQNDTPLPNRVEPNKYLDSLLKKRLQ